MNTERPGTTWLLASSFKQTDVTAVAPILRLLKCSLIVFRENKAKDKDHSLILYCSCALTNKQSPGLVALFKRVSDSPLGSVQEGASLFNSFMGITRMDVPKLRVGPCRRE